MDEAAAQPPVVPAHIMLCAICLQTNGEVAATTTVNGTSLCSPHAQEAPKASLPYGDEG